MPALHQKAMLVDLSFGMFAPTKTDKKATKEVIDANHASSDAGRFVKAVIPKDALESIRTVVSEAKAFHNKKSLPWNDKGMRILPAAHYLEYTDKMRKLKARFDAEVDIFVAKYQELVDRRRDELKGMFNPNDYPSKDIVRDRFKFKTDFSPVPDSDDFRVSLTQEDLDEVRAEIDSRVKEAVDNARLELWARLREPVQNMAVALKDPKKKFHDTLVGNVRDILNLIPTLNLTDDPQLDAIRTEIEAELVKHAPDTLRDNKRIRKETCDKANSILQKMAGFMPMLTGEPAADVQPIEDAESVSCDPEPHSESECHAAPLAEPTNIIALPTPVAAPVAEPAPVHACTQLANGFLF